MLTGWSLHLENMEMRGIEEAPRKIWKSWGKGEKTEKSLEFYEFCR